jgi:hypothetical protein
MPSRLAGVVVMGRSAHRAIAGSVAVSTTSPVRPPADNL